MKNKFVSLFIASLLTFGFYAQQFGPIVILPGQEGSNPRDFKQLGNLLIFTASDSPSYYPRKIFRSDGTNAGTYQLMDSIDGGYLDDSAFVKLDNYLYFRAIQNGNSTLWRTDGSVNGTTMVYAGDFGRMVVLNQNLYFLISISDPVWLTSSTKLMKYDPLSNITTEVYNWNNSNLLNGTSPLRVYNNKIYFYGWQSDGTTANTIQNNVNFPQSSESCVYNGLIYYQGSNGKLWRSDGTTSGTFQAVDFPVSKGITVFNNLMYFAGGNVGAGMQGTEFCSSDGTLANTNVVKDIYFGYYSSGPSDFSIVNGSLFFLADDGISGREIYKTDGTSNGTVLLKDIEQGISDSFHANFYPYERYNSKIEHQNQLFFNISQNWSSNNGIWKSDGTTANTNQVFQIDTTRSLMDVNGKLFFAGYTPNEGWELYAEGLTSSLIENYSKTFSVYPNPTNDKITIRKDNGITEEEFVLFDHVGNELLRIIPLNGISEIDLSHLTTGIYFLNVGGQNQSVKIVKN
jgi:ELWxxDGT repeat protein